MSESAPSGKEPLLGLILAGGLSSRMGLHKPALKVHGEAEPDMLVRTTALLAQCTGEVWISCRPGQPVGGYHCLHDQEEGLGPIGGIYTALQALQSGPWAGMLVLSCDLPFMSLDCLHSLIAAHSVKNSPAPQLMTTFLQADTGYIEALVSIYAREALPYFAKAVQGGVRQINRVIPPERRRDVPYERSEALPFFNINYPADLEMARRLIQAL